MIFRKSTLNDCEKVYDRICELERKTLPYEKFAEIYAAQLGSGQYYCLVAEKDDAILAVLNLRFEEQLHHVEKIAEVMEFSVDPACRSRGIGKQMFAKALEIAKDQGCAQLELSSNRLRTDAHRFYLREGMHDFHLKFSKRLTGEDSAENAIGKI